ncbi:hydroxypyruvate isomerase family protein [Yoonia sp. R2331]|uniref:hydroxypyruvate isomerase family protein n=1 Tax=Yoonia sp. R2331 TaxID=3237238 RepID=UPI0034E47252
MPRFCANLTFLFTEVPLMERFVYAKEAGFEAVEILDPYNAPVQDMRDQLVWQGLKMALISCPPPNYTGGAPGYAAVPESRFRQDFKRTLRYAEALGAEFVQILAGEAEGPEARATFVDNLRWASGYARRQKLTIEPLNPVDHPGHFLNDYYQARDVLEEVSAPNLHLQFDTYQVARIHGDVMSVWGDLRDFVAHVQIAQALDQSEPIGPGVDFPAFFDRLDADGYDGWVSAEYHPAGTTVQGLGWFAAAYQR